MSTRVFRKSISLLLTVAMILSLSSFSALATGTEAFVSGTVVKNGEQVTSTDNNVTVQKTAQKVTGENDTFDITLRVTTNDKVETVTRETAAHVVLVIDTSGSMNANRITNAKNAATTFANTMLGTNAADNNKVAVVTYSKGATTHIGLSGKASLSAVNSKISAIGNEDDGGTNIQAGIKKAQEILAAGTVTGVKNIIVLLSDGVPTYSYRLTGTATWTGCTTGWFGSHDWETGWSGDGGIDASTIEITDTTTTLVGNGSDYTTSNNISLTYTCTHGKSGSGNYSFNGTTLGSGNHGVATRWQASAAKDAGTEIYSVLLMSTGDGGYITANSVMGGIASSGDHYKSTGDMTALAELFGKISEDITTPTNAGLVIDPMGEFIQFDGIKLESRKDPAVSAASFDGEAKTLTWDTSKSTFVTSGSSKTYTLTYTVKLNTSDPEFTEDQAYLANGTTTFHYEVGTAARSVNFDVPTVSGKIPMVEYSVRYYLDGVLQTNDTIARTGTLHSTVSLVNIDSGYQTKYQYYQVSSATTSLELTQGDNYLDVYYTREKVVVTVEHYLKTTTIKADGTETTGGYEKITGTPGPDTVDKGSSYTATKRTDYTFDSVDPSLTIDPVVNDTNTIKLYYSRTVDERAVTTVVVNHKYNTYEWALEGGVYTKRLVEGVSQKITEATNLRAPAPYSASTADVNGYTYQAGSAVAVSGGTSITASENPASNTVSFTLGADANTLTLTFVKDVPVPSAAEAMIKVIHKYTKSVTTIVGGVPVTNTDANEDIIEYLPLEGKYYAGETRTVFANKTQPGDGNTYSVVGDSQKSITLTAEGNEVTFEYHLESAPEKASVTINHIFRTFEDYTDEQGNTQTREITDYTDSVTLSNKYVGEILPVAENPEGRSGYKRNDKEGSYSDNTVTVPAGGTTITIYYDKMVDGRDDASILVTHTYYTNVTKVINGTVQTVREPAGTEGPVTMGGKVGDEYAAEEIREHDGHSDWERTDGSTLTGTFIKGTNPTIALVYERSADERTPASYVVNYYYYDWTMTIKDGKAGYYSGEGYALNSENKGTIVTDRYVGEKITLTNEPKDGYVASLSNPALEQFLTDGENIYNFNYVKQIPLGKINVNVTHNYALTTISATGESSVLNTSTPANLTGDIYAGETVNVPAAPQGYTLSSVTVTSGESSVTYTQSGNGDVSFTAPNADATVIFNYVKTDDNSVRATYTIEHYYRTKDWNGSLSDYVLDNSGTKNTGGTSYATKTVAFQIYDENGYVKDEIAVTGGIREEYVLTLAAGENTVKVYYTKEIDSRTPTRVKVVHNYYSLDTYTNTHSTTPEKTVVEYVEARDAEEKLVLWVGGTYTAVPVYSYTVGSNSYTAAKFDPANSNDPADLTIHELGAYHETGEDGQEQVDTITINYLREYSTYSPPYNPPDNGDDDDDTPTTPTTPTPPTTDIPEENPPLDPGPVIDGGEVEIPEEEAPLAPAPEVELPDEATPLADKTVPQTGDNSNTALFALLAALSVFGLGALHFKPRKKTED